MKKLSYEELESKVLGLTDQLSYYKWVYKAKCSQVDDLLAERKSLLNDLNTLIKNK